MKIKVMYRQPTNGVGRRIHVNPFVESVSYHTVRNGDMMEPKKITTSCGYFNVPPASLDGQHDGQIFEMDLTKNNAEVLLHYMEELDVFQLVDPEQLPMLEAKGPFEKRKPIYKKNDPRDPAYQKVLEAEKLKRSQDAIQVNVMGNQVRTQFDQPTIDQIMPYANPVPPKVVQAVPVPEITTTSESIESPVFGPIEKPEWEKFTTMEELKDFAKLNRIKLGQGRQSVERMRATITEKMAIIDKHKALVGG